MPLLHGGICGRVDAVFTSIEVQNFTGSLHAHSLFVIQCLHQHTGVHGIISMLRNNCTHVVPDYSDYKTHVCRQVYPTDTVALEQQLDKHETAWPDYKDSIVLATIPAYLQEPSGDDVKLHDTDQLPDNIVKGPKRLDTYLHEDVEDLQQMKQHHVHFLNVDTHVREPLAACKRKGNPNLCKADFPRMKWLVTKAVI